MGSILFIGDIYLRFSGFHCRKTLFSALAFVARAASCELATRPIISYINAIVLVSNSGIRPGMYNENIYAYM